MRLACGALAVCLAWTPAVPAAGYQIYGVRAGTRVVAMKWARMPVRYHVTDRSGGSVSAAQLQQAVGRAFSSWQQVATSSASADFVGFTSADPFDDDGMVTLGFMSRPDLERVLGATNFLVDDVTGEIVESDIFFNSAFPWSVSSGGESGRYDLESIALHEIGHLFGLGHSALGETELRTGGGRRVIAAESVMFPIAFSAGSTAERAPRADDIAGLSELYPDGGFEQTTGMIQGHITQDGRGVFGAHVVAFNPATGKLTGAFTVDGSGSFGIRGLDPGLHILRVEPVDDADLDSFFDQPEDVDLNFPVTYFDRYVAAPKGGASEMAEVAVTRLTGVAPAPVTTTVRNPTSIEFGASADHDGRLPEGRAMVERYLIEIYPRGGEESVLRASIGKPAPGADGVVRLDFSSSVPGWPPQTGIYEARVVAWGPAGVGRSEASNAFSIGTIVDERRSAPPESGDETAAVAWRWRAAALRVGPRLVLARWACAARVGQARRSGRFGGDAGATLQTSGPARVASGQGTRTGPLLRGGYELRVDGRLVDRLA